MNINAEVDAYGERVDLRVVGMVCMHRTSFPVCISQYEGSSRYSLDRVTLQKTDGMIDNLAASGESLDLDINFMHNSVK